MKQGELMGDAKRKQEAAKQEAQRYYECLKEVSLVFAHALTVNANTFFSRVQVVDDSVIMAKALLERLEKEKPPNQ
jgi:hypothetical protein